MVKFEEINRDNFWEVIELKVSDDQEDYIASNAVSIAQAKVQPECIPLAIYDKEQLVGFLMYCMDEDDHEYWIYRIMIARDYQGKGYGKEAMKLLQQRIEEDKEHHIIYLGVHKENKRARNLYESLGFVLDGRAFGLEVVYKMTY